MFVICVNCSSLGRSANAAVFIIDALLPLYWLPLNKAPAIILSSCLTVSFEGIGGKVEDSFFLFDGILEARQKFSFLLQSGGLIYNWEVLVLIICQKKWTN